MQMDNNYSEKLKDPRWQKKRLKIMERDSFTCQYCKDKETTLNVHHLKYSKGFPWNISDKYLITVCEDCHKIINQYGEISSVLKLKGYDGIRFDLMIIKRPMNEFTILKSVDKDFKSCIDLELEHIEEIKTFLNKP